MHLSPKETNRLLLFMAAELARKRRARGLRLNYRVGTRAAGRRDPGGSARRQVGGGADVTRASLLTTDDVLPGVAKLVGTLQVEGFFPDGQKLVTIHDPIAPGRGLADGVEPGEIVTADGEIGPLASHANRQRLGGCGDGWTDTPCWLGSSRAGT
jgi:urease subunit gamma/beta